MVGLFRSFVGVAILLGTASQGMAQRETYERVQLLDVQLDVQSGMATSMEIPGGWRYVKKIYVTAESYFGDSTFQVFVNGDEKAKAYVPNKDPLYVVTVAETASRIVIKNVSGPGVLRVKSVEADLSLRTIERDSLPPTWNGPVIRYPARNEAASFGRDAVEIVGKLKPYTDEANEYVTYLLPIKVVAGRVIANANARGNGSSLVRDSLQALAVQIDFADEYIEQMFRTPGAFEDAAKLLALKESIKDWMD